MGVTQLPTSTPAQSPVQLPPDVLPPSSTCSCQPPPPVCSGVPPVPPAGVKPPGGERHGGGAGHQGGTGSNVGGSHGSGNSGGVNGNGSPGGANGSANGHPGGANGNGNGHPGGANGNGTPPGDGPNPGAGSDPGGQSGQALHRQILQAQRADETLIDQLAHKIYVLRTSTSSDAQSQALQRVYDRYVPLKNRLEVLEQARDSAKTLTALQQLGTQERVLLNSDVWNVPNARTATFDYTCLAGGVYTITADGAGKPTLKRVGGSTGYTQNSWSGGVNGGPIRVIIAPHQSNNSVRVTVRIVAGEVESMSAALGTF